MDKKKKGFNKNNRMRFFILIVIFLLLLLIIRIGWLQFVDGKTLKEKSYNQSTTNRIISPKRGTIYDSTGKPLAISASVDTVTINPKLIVAKKTDTMTKEEATNKLKEKISKAFSDIFELDYNEVYEKVTSTSRVETIASKVEKDKIDELKQWMKDTDTYSGINIDEDTKRYYPYNNLASNLIGFCGKDNDGSEGIESKWDSVLKGTPGKIITSIDVTQDAIPDKNEEYIPPENGNNIYLTIDSTIQSISEKYLKQAVEENNCKRGGNVIIMDPSSGDILAMATYPDYNLNEPYTPNSWISEGWDELSSTEKSNKLYSMYRNRAVVDTYEPGSTFKVITASIALEENLAKTDTPGDFYCSGVQHVADSNIHCTSQSGHGSQTLRNALENSCNPALIQLGQRIGGATFYKYLRAYGFFDKTGVALPYEESSNFWDEDDLGPVSLATMSFGQRFTITPLQLITAISSIANDGVLMQPRIVKQIENSDTNAITQLDPVAVRQVVSKETAEKVRDIMHSVVVDGGGRYAQVKGYEIGGKTGTSEPNPLRPEDGYVSSFVAIAPVENTKVCVLLTLYDPQTSNYYGGHTAGPAVSQILSEVLPYLGIPANSSDNEIKTENLKTVPNVQNKTIAEAKKAIEALGLTYSTNGNADSIVTEQVPKPGTQLLSGGVVKLYDQEHSERVSQTVPSLKGKTLAQAKNILRAKNLNIGGSGSGIITSQSPAAESSIEEGSVITVTMQEETDTSQH